MNVVVAAVMGLALSLCAWGQATTSLRGTVSDPSGAMIANAKITLTNTATNASRATLSGANGLYSFVSVLPGTYKLTVQAPGFHEYVQSGLELLVNLPATANVRLEIGATAETVEVTGHAPLLNTTDASVGDTMGTNTIENLPMRAESMPLLLSLQPGVVFNGSNTDQTESRYDTRAGSVNGERSDQNNITLDGVSDNKEFDGYAFNGVLPTTPFSTQEFRVTTSNYDATQGRSAGAQITMVTKGGTNNFHGNLYEFNRNTIGEANDWFLKQSQLGSGLPNRPEKLIRNVFGGDIGGPIMKNRLFFFFNYEGHRQSHSVSSLRTIPSMTLRDGIIQYACNDATQCPGMSVKGMSGNSYSIAPGYFALSPSQLAAMDPLGIGPSPVTTAFMQTYPVPNAPAPIDGPNYAGYRFAAPIKDVNNWYIARLDYNLTANGNHALFLRGTIVNDRSSGTPYLPGAVPETATVDLSKGFVAGYTAVLTPNIVNSFRYGLTRASVGVAGNSSQPWNYFRDFSDYDVTRSHGAVDPVHNIVDTVGWRRGSHNFQFGANIIMTRRQSYTLANSFSDAILNADWGADGGFAGTGDALDPAAAGYPVVGGDHAYDFPLASMMGLASEVDAQYNYHVNSPTSATPLAQGAPVFRHWATDTYNLYWQDTWQARRNLTLTYGLNWQLMTPITETAGQQAEPNVNMGQWFNQRGFEMKNGLPSNLDPLIAFSPAGSKWGRSGMYGTQTKNFSPRLGIAYSPNPSSGWLNTLFGENKTSIRAGAGMYYDNFGPALAMRYDAGGSFGLATNVSNPAGSLAIQDIPRITDMHVIPTTDNSGNPIMEPDPGSQFPVTFPNIEAIATGIDQSLKTPYSYAVDLSIQRELPGRMVLDMGYVGHYGHRGLALDDIATPLDLVDPATGVDYFSAAQALAKLYYVGVPMSQVTPQMVGSTASYWTDMFVQPASAYNRCATGATNQLQAAYGWMSCFAGNETLGLWEMDVRNHAPLPVGGENSYYNSQYSSLWAWRSMANSNYHALQVGLRKEMTHGVMFQFNYTYSHSLDIASFAERAAHFLTDSIINPWDPHQMYGPSDFDLRHQINAYWVAELPFGKGHAFAGNAHGVLDALIGGWQIAGTTRWTSGFPFSVFMSYVWPTNWDEMGWANQVAPAPTGTTIVNGTPYVFKDPTAALNSFNFALPGQSGQRNNLRGQGFVDTDMNLSKTWKLTESKSFQFRWQVFNVFNSHRFDVQGIQDEQDAGSFGAYTNLLTDPRTMEFGGVFTF